MPAPDRGRSAAVLAATLLLFAAGLSGCGGDGGSRGPTTGTDRTGDGAGGESAEVEGEGRLGSDVLPERYALDLSVDPSRDALFGAERIYVDITRRTDTIELHGRGLDIREVSVQVLGDEALDAEWQPIDDEGLARLALPQPVGPGAAIIRVVWSAPYSQSLQGAYRVEMGDDSYVFTQFEPLSARTVFPCFDEPRFKTPYDLSLTVRPTDVAVANGVTDTRVDAINDRKRVRFERTKPLPTYLVAFAVGPFDVVEAEIPPNDVRSQSLPFRGLAPAGRGELLGYAMEQTPVLLAALEDYFGTAYPYEKLDIVAVPDFGAGAMENAALVTFRDTLLLLDPDSASAAEKMRFAGTMAHELAHHWFGNQVTLAWWNDLWLNEGFATWVESKATEAWSPRDQPALHDRLWVMSAMRVDGLESARQVRQPISSSHDIHNAFDAITYGKGAGVLAMYERWLGEATFRDAVRRYLRENRRAGVARSEDFFAAVNTEAEEDLTPSMTTFLEQPGIPVLETNLVCDDEGPPRVMVRQSRYRPAGSTLEAEGQWQVPVCIKFSGGGRTCAMVTEAEQGIPLEGADGCPRWYHPDAEGQGYYAWTMPSEQLDDLRRRGLDDLTAAEKLSLVNALNAGFRSGAFSADDVLSLYRRFTIEDDRPVAIAPMDVLGFIADHLVDENQETSWRKYARGLYERHYDRLGWEVTSRREPGQTARLRGDVIRFMVDVADQRSVLNEAVREARALTGYRRDDEWHLDAVPPELIGTTLVLASEDGDSRWFDHLEELFDETADPLLRRALLNALSSFRDDDLAERSRQLVFDERLRSNERFTPLAAQLSDERTREDTWAFMQENWDQLTETISPYALAYMPRLTGGFCSAEKAAEVEAFFAPKVAELPGAPRNLASTLETIRLCSATADAQRAAVRRFLTERSER